MVMTNTTTILKQLADSYYRNDLYICELNQKLMAISDRETMAHNDDRVLVCLFVYSLITCNLRVMAMLQINTKKRAQTLYLGPLWDQSQNKS
jgi:hypothetical protein